MARMVSTFYLALISLCLMFNASAAARKPVGFYEIKNEKISLTVTNWGATIYSLFLPDKQGNLADCVLGFESLGDYLNDHVYFGAIPGRVANRIGGARFVLNGKAYRTYPNEGRNTLHGGHRGFSDVFWTVEKHVKDGPAPYITLTYHSFDGEEGFPGDLDVSVTYMLAGDTLSVTMKAKALNKATPVNLAQHTYWNLGGHNSGDILSNTVKIFGSKITPVDGQLIPTGEITSVEGTPYDFREPQTVGSRIDQLPAGYDINYVLDGEDEQFKKVAVVHDSKSGRMLELWANKPGLQFYTGNKLANEKGKEGSVYGAHAGLCLETQGFPDAVNHPNFPSQIVNPGEVYHHFMLFRFSTA